jgi:hypothetical protein
LFVQILRAGYFLRLRGRPIFGRRLAVQVCVIFGGKLGVWKPNSHLEKTA